MVSACTLQPDIIHHCLIPMQNNSEKLTFYWQNVCLFCSASTSKMYGTVPLDSPLCVSQTEVEKLLKLVPLLIIDQK